jgi:hypothetical protein
MEVTPLSHENAKEIIECWLANKHKLTTEQWTVLNRLFEKSVLYPLYIKLIFDIVLKWTSYYSSGKLFLNWSSDDHCIKYIFEKLENIHGRIVFSRCMFYLTLFNDGISENELEDILSIDDDVLSDVFQHHEPTVRRFPGALWMRIKNDLGDYIFESKAEDIRVLHW